MDQLFTTFGAPETYKTDNGSPFQSHQFKEFTKKWGFKHRRVTPEWPRANGKAESFMKKLGKVLKTSKVSGQNRQEALREFLRRYRETPHSSTGVSPNHLLLGFSRSSGIPSMLPETPEQREKWRQIALRNDAKAKSRMEAEYNQRMRAREATIAVGSRVLLKLKKHNKGTSAWDVDPYTVIAVNGSMITAKRHDRTTTRNSSQFKLQRCEVDEDGASKTAATRELEPVTPQATEAERGEETPPSSSEPETPPAYASEQARSRGRPTAEESKEIERQRKIAEEARRAVNPPTRESQRLRSKTRSNQ